MSIGWRMWWIDWSSVERRLREGGKKSMIEYEYIKAIDSRVEQIEWSK